MRAWPGDDSVAHLIFVDHHHTPTPSDLTAAVDHAGRKGARAIRTSALFPDAAAVVLAAGFTPIDRLALLRTELDTWFRRHRDEAPDPAAGPDRATHRLTPMRAWHLTPCSRIDREAFGLMWGNTPASLRDIRRATPWHRARLARHHRSIVGFAISGAAADTGYIQRLAVVPERRRRGAAVDLVTDALIWMHARGLSEALVNTGVDNVPALTLYDSLGFQRLEQELVIAELRQT